MADDSNIEPIKKKKGKLSKEQKAVLEAEVGRLAAEEHFLTEQSKSAHYTSEMLRLDFEGKERAHEELMAKDFYHHTYRFVGAVDDKSVADCMYHLSQWDRRYPECDITIVFTSPGGSVVAGLALWDFLTELRQRHTLTTIAQGMAASMAGILLQAGDKRVLGRESYILIHQVQAAAMGSWGDIQDRVKWLAKVQERIINIFVARSKLTKRQIESKWERTDWWIDSEEALRLGLIDEVV